jgi:ABC-2 type transport system permease protein
MKLMVLKYFNLWLAFFKNSLTRDMEFKMNFIGDLLIDSIFYGSMYFFWSVIFSYVDVLGDFNQQAVIIFLIVMYLTDTVFVFFFGANTFTLNTMVVKGELDFVLIKPVNPQFFLSFRYVSSYSIVSFLILFSLLLKLVYDYHGFISVMTFLLFLLSFILGILIFYSIEFIISCLVFWYRNFSVGGWLSSEMTKYSRRPDSIYKGKFRRIVFTIFPMAMITSVPARILIFGPQLYLILSQFLVTIIFLFIATLIWNRGLKLYESASS